MWDAGGGLFIGFTVVINGSGGVSVEEVAEHVLSPRRWFAP